MQLSFDIGTENLGYGGTDRNATFEFKIDGQVVETITVQEIMNKTGGQANEMAHFDIVADVGAAGTHTLELTDTTARGQQLRLLAGQHPGPRLDRVSPQQGEAAIAASPCCWAMSFTERALHFPDASPVWIGLRHGYREVLVGHIHVRQFFGTAQQDAERAGVLNS